MTPSSSTRSDSELLASFVRTGDGTSFAALTERHLGLVFGTAFRRTGSREMAQEAAQNTFCRLARHAPRIWTGSSLAPWLHTVALREAGTLMRAEAARQRAMHRLAALVEAEVSTSSPAGPPPGSEHLDEALAALPESARRVLLLRFLQGMSLREVAHAEKTSEEAVRKRVTRALDRLTYWLARRGVTASAVTACLAAAPVLWPAPAAAALSSHALKQAAFPAAGSLGGIWGRVVGHGPAAAVFLLAAIPAAWPWGMVPPRVEDVFVPAKPPPPLTVPDATHGNQDAAPPTALIAGLEQELRKFRTTGWRHRNMTVRSMNSISLKVFPEWPLDVVRLAAVRRVVMDFSLAEVKAAAALPDSETAGLIGGVIHARWAEWEPQAARQAAILHANRTKSHEALLGVAGVQALTDPEGAVRWAMAHDPGIGKGRTPEQSRTLLVQTLLEPMRSSDPGGYVLLMALAAPAGESAALVSILPYAPGTALAGLLALEQQGSPGSPTAFDGLVRGEELQPAEAEFMVSFAAQLPPDSQLRLACHRTGAFVFANSDPSRAADLMAASQPAAVKAEADWFKGMTYLLKDWKDADPTAAAGWLRSRTQFDPDIHCDLARLSGLPIPALEIPLPPAAP